MGRGQVRDLGDDRLVSGVARGEFDALRELYRRYAPCISAMAMLMTSQAEVRRAIVDDAFLTLWRRAGEFEPAKASFRTWLLTIAHRRAVLRIRMLAEPAHQEPAVEGDGVDALLPSHLDEKERRLLSVAFFRGVPVARLAEYSPDSRERPAERLRRALFRLADGYRPGAGGRRRPEIRPEEFPADNLILDYALGTIEPERSRQVEAVLAVRDELAGEIRRIQDSLATMVGNLPRLSTEAEDEERLIELAQRSALRTGSPRRSSAGSGPLWAALVLAVTLGVTAWVLFLRFRSGGEVPPPPAAVQQSNEDIDESIDDELGVSGAVGADETVEGADVGDVSGEGGGVVDSPVEGADAEFAGGVAVGEESAGGDAVTRDEADGDEAPSTGDGTDTER